MRFLLMHFAEHAVAIGMLTILTELLMGLLILVGLFTRLAAVTGLVLNLIFFLSASWHVYPYFLGSDVVFVMCWLTLMMAGPGGFCLDNVVLERFGGRIARPWGRLLLGPLPMQPEDVEDDRRSAGWGRVSGRLMSRGEIVLGGAATAVFLLLGLWPRGKASGQAAPVAAGLPTPRKGGGSPSSGGSGGSNGSGASALPGGHKVGNLSQLPPNTAGTLTDPKSGDPAIIIHAGGSQVYAYDAVCTHAGCTVQYDSQQKLLVCPCHGAEYDPARGAAVVAGPAPTPLIALPIKVDNQGNIYLV